MDIATNIKVNVTVEEDGSWSVSWAWTNSSSKSFPSLREDILIEDLQGLIIDRVKEPLHSVGPGETCIGDSAGAGKVRPGENVCRLKVFSDVGELVGEGGSRFFAMIPE